jgi:hypothetical protein
MAALKWSWLESMGGLVGTSLGSNDEKHKMPKAF